MSKECTFKELKIWNKGSVLIFPSLKWSEKYSYEQLKGFVEKLKEKLPDMNIVIYDQNSYCSEVNGYWNVSFGVQTTGVNAITYMYMIRRDNDEDKNIGGSYGCPFMNTEYIYDLRHTSLSTKPEYLKKVESKLEEIIGKAQRITYFHT